MSLGRITTIAAVTCALAPALVWGQGDRMLGGANAVGGGGDTSRGMLSVDVSGIHSWDDWFYPLNEELFPQVDPNAHIIGLGWDVTITTKPWALLTDVRVLFIGVETANMFSLAPGMDDDFGGTASYSSGGIVDLRPRVSVSE